MKYQIGALELDDVHLTLLKEGKPLADGTRPAMLLALLLENYPDYCSHKMLLERLWPDTVVSQWSLSRLVSDTRKLFRDNDYTDPLIQTLAGRGYRLAPELAERLLRSQAQSPQGHRAHPVAEQVASPADSASPRSGVSRVLLPLFSLVVTVVLGIALVNLVRPPEVGNQVQTLKQASVRIQADGSDDITEQTLDLPYLWDTHNPGRTGTAEFRLKFDYPLANSHSGETMASAEPPSLYIPRVGNRYEITINGSVLATAGSLNTANGEDHGMQPVLYPLPPALLRARDNQLGIRVRADLGRRGGLSSVVIGPRRQVQPLYAYDYRWVVPGTIFSVVCSLLIALAGLVLWFLQVRVGGYRRDGDALYAYLIIAELAWAVRAGSVLMTDPPVPWPYGGILVIVAIALWAPALWYFYAVVGEWQQSRAWALARQWLFVLMATSPLVGWLALVRGLPEVLTWWYLLCMATWCLMLIANLRYFVRGTLIQRILLATLLVNVLVGAYDLYNFRITTSDMGSTTWMRYSVLLFGLSLLVALIIRFRAILQFSGQYSSELPARTPVSGALPDG